MSEDRGIYLPRVLFEAAPELRAALTGAAGVRGELLAWPFAGGALLLGAVSGLTAEGLCALRLEGDALPVLPALSVCGGFAYGLTHAPLSMERLYGVRAVLGEGLAAGTFLFY